MIGEDMHQRQFDRELKRFLVWMCAVALVMFIIGGWVGWQFL